MGGQLVFSWDQLENLLITRDRPAQITTIRTAGIPTRPGSLYPMLVPGPSVEHDPVSGSRPNQILHFRSGSRMDWILKKTQPDQIWISKVH